ncbi:MAG: hypothetical protein JO240_11950 [Solirubrobacterales bacterium]|nr:hypothetical protein [Solirubrobacterales bacterium]
MPLVDQGLVDKRAGGRLKILPRQRSRFGTLRRTLTGSTQTLEVLRAQGYLLPLARAAEGRAMK